MAENPNWLIIDGAKIRVAPPSLGTRAIEFLMGANGREPVRNRIQYWNKYADKRKDNYEQMTRLLRYKAPRIMAEMIAPHIKGVEDVLDVGCGSGLVGAHLMEIHPFLIDGVDFSSAMIKKAAQRGYRNLVCADIEQESLAMAVAEKVGYGKRYPVIVSVGVYGDFVGSSYIVNALQLAQDSAIVGVAGRAERLGEIELHLQKAGFSPVSTTTRGAHLFKDDGKRSPIFDKFFCPVVSGKSANYKFIIAKRN